MQNLPTPEVYTQEVNYMPWGILIHEVEQYVHNNAPKGGRTIDLLCGTGYLLGEIQKIRPDLQYTGVDFEKEYIDFARQQHPQVEFILSDAMEHKADNEFDVVLCTGGLHHIPHEKQKDLVKQISTMVKKDGFAIVGDPYIGNYSNEKERKLAVAKLGYEYLVATIDKDAPDYMVQVAIDLIPNDIFKVEYKSSVEIVEPYFKEFFSKVEKHKTWPNEETDYGDYYFILRK